MICFKFLKRVCSLVVCCGLCNPTAHVRTHCGETIVVLFFHFSDKVPHGRPAQQQQAGEAAQLLRLRARHGAGLVRGPHGVGASPWWSGLFGGLLVMRAVGWCGARPVTWRAVAEWRGTWPVMWPHVAGWRGGAANVAQCGRLTWQVKVTWTETQKHVSKFKKSRKHS